MDTELHTAKTVQEKVVDISDRNPFLSFIIDIVWGALASVVAALCLIGVTSGTQFLLSQIQLGESKVVIIALDTFAYASCVTAVLGFIIVSLYQIYILYIRLKKKAREEAKLDD